MAGFLANIFFLVVASVWEGELGIEVESRFNLETFSLFVLSIRNIVYNAHGGNSNKPIFNKKIVK